MSLEPIGLATIAIGLLCLWLGQRSASIVFVATAVFGSAAAVLIGGNNIQPAHLFLAFLAATVLLRRQEIAAAIATVRLPEPGFWFACLVVYGVIAAFVLPRLLAGSTLIVPLGISQYGEVRSMVPLGPVSSNVTQSIYMVADLICLMLVVGIASTRDGLRAVTYGLLAYAVANTLFALLDLATYAVGAQRWLDFMRNAKYTLHNEEEVSGLKRIVGSFTEASSFARSTLGVLGFTATMWLCGRHVRLTGSLALASIVLLVLSTSSTAIAGLPVLVVLLYLTAWHVAVVRRRLSSWAVVVLAPVLAGVVITGILLDNNASAVIGDYIDVTVLNKLSTSSGIERSLWNTAALQNFLDTWGVGVGLGTTRSSNFFLALLSNLGVLGLIFYGLFVYTAFLRPRGTPHTFPSDVRLAARNACFGLMIGDLLLSPVVDQGLFFYVLAGIAAAVPVRARNSEQTLSARWEAA
ncbi:MAG: hypothetical protein Q8R02_23985 [Hyphomonadaceae bacterium]|nr:hypothetical protein [Hyphomonadaceae bacterium]